MKSKANAASLLALCVAALMVLGGVAQASPGAYKVLLAEPYPEGPHELGKQLEAFPEIASIAYVDTSAVTPTGAELAPYDLVVSVGDNSYLDSEAWGDSLATFVEGGGVVVQAGYDSWENVELGRFHSGGFEPFIPGDNANSTVELGEYDAVSPLMTGVTNLKSIDNTAPELAAGATLVAKWNNGANAVAVKGKVVSVTAFIGDSYGEGIWSGDYGRLIFNAVHTLDPIPPAPPIVPPVEPTKPVTPPAQVAPPTPAPPSNVLKLGKVTFDRKNGTAKLAVTLASPGSVALSGKGIRKATRSGTAPNAAVTVPVKLVGKAKQALTETGKAKVKATLTFTPTGGTAASKAKSLTLKKDPS